MNKHVIVFKKMEIQNFLSVGPKLTIDFPEYEGMNYVFGYNYDLGTNNGSGKSTIFVDSLLFALFGKTLRPITRKHIPNRNFACEGDTFVNLEFMIGNDTYLIERQVSRKLFCVSVTIYENGKDITKGGTDANNELLENNILKSNWNVFKNCIVLSSNEQNSFLQMSRGQKRKFIEEVFDLSVFGIMEAKTKEDAKSVETEMMSTQKIIKKIERDICQFIDEHEKFEKNKQGRLNILVDNIKSRKADYDNTITEIADAKTEKENLSKLVSTFDDETFTKLRDSEHHISSKVKQLVNENKSHTKYLSKYTDILNELGDCCRPNVEEKFSIIETTKQIETNAIVIEKYKELLAKIKSQNTILKKKQREMVSHRERLYSKDVEIRHLTQSVKTIVGDIKKIKSDIENIEQNQPFKELIEQNEKTLNANVEVLEGYVERHQYLQALQLIVSDMGVKRFIIKDLIDILNNRISFYLKKLNSSYICLFDNNFDCTFVTETGECSYDNFSTGERARINVAVLFAFREMLFNQGNLVSSVLVLDEFLDSGLDKVAIDELMKILIELQDNNQVDSIIMISHRECVDSSDFDRIITVQKNNGMSSIV